MSRDLLVPLAVSGVVVGIMYGILGVGLVVSYRTSRTLNFAHGALGMFFSYVFYRTLRPALGTPLALVITVVAAAGGGMVLERLVIRKLEGQSALAKVITTIGVMLTLQSAAVILWGDGKRPVQGFLPRGTAIEFSNLAIGMDQLIIGGVLLVVVGALALLFRSTDLGVALRAIAESHAGAELLGIRADRIRAVGWAIGGILAALAGLLLSPLVFLDPIFLTLMLIPAYAAALVGKLRSIVMTAVGGVALGVLQSLVPYVSDSQGVAQALPFIVIMAALLVQSPEERAAGEAL